MKNSIVKIESVVNSSFGTGFVINKDEEGVFILTCQHIVEDVVTPVVDQVLAKVIAQDAFVDMAILYVPKLVTEPLLLQKAKCEKLKVDVIGFSHFNRDLTQKKHISATLYEEGVELHSNENSQHFNVHKIKANDGFKFERGNSGSPVICKKTNNVIAMISNKEGNDIAYAIDIEQLTNIWKEMPEALLSGVQRKKKPIIEEKTIKVVKKRFFNITKLKLTLFFVFFLLALYALSEMDTLSTTENTVVRYHDLAISLQNVKKVGNEISLDVVIQNNGKKIVTIAHPYHIDDKIKMTDENGKVWRLTSIESMANEYDSPTQIFNDGRRIISTHQFIATDRVDGKDFYLNLQYLVNKKWVSIFFDHIRL